jgi:hypothetical protein
MGIRISLGPVFAYEARRASRSWHTFAHRSLLGLALLGATFLIWHIKTAQVVPNRGYHEKLSLPPALSLKLTSDIAQAIFQVMVVIQLAFVFLIAPATIAGTVCQDRLTGTLADMLASGFAAWEIVVGRLAARLLAILSTVICIIPVVSACMLLGGIEVKTLVAVPMVTAGVAILASTLALALAVGRGKTHEVTLATYAILSLVFFLDPLMVWFGRIFGWVPLAPRGLGVAAEMTGWEILNPFWLALAPYYQPSRARLEQPTLFLVGSALAGCFLTFFSIARLRGSCVTREDFFKKEPTPFKKKSSVSWREKILRPVLDRNPVLWLDLCYGTGGRRSVALWSLCVAATIGLIGLAIWKKSNVALANSIQISLGLLLVSVPAAARLGEDRANGTLGTLLVTPLTSRSITLGKWLSAYRWVPWLAVIPCVALISVSRVRANPVDIMLMFALILAYGAAVTSLGLCLATAIPNVGRAIGATVSVCALYCVGISILSDYSQYLVGKVFGLVLVLSPIGLTASWGFSLIASTFKSHRAHSVYAYFFVGAFIALAILLPPLALSCNAWVPKASVRIGIAAFALLSLAGFVLMKSTARISKDSASEFGLFALFCACWLPMLIGCLDDAWTRISWMDGWEWEKGISYASPWTAGRVMINNAMMTRNPSPEAISWIRFWILSFASVGAFLLRATQVSLDHHFERAHHL